MADVDPSLVQKIFYIPQGKWEPDIHHHSKADDLGARLEVTKGAVLCHDAEPRARPPTAQGRFNLTVPKPQRRHPTRSCSLPARARPLAKRLFHRPHQPTTRARSPRQNRQIGNGNHLPDIQYEVS